MKKQDLRKVIDLLKSVEPEARHEGALDMGEIRVNKESHACGTVHCHGGWFAVAALKAGLLEGKVYFEAGADLMAQMLGFSRPFSLTQWAEDNPELWGNKYGDSMFGDKIAFFHPTKRPHGAKSLADIVDHWEEVCERL